MGLVVVYFLLIAGMVKDMKGILRMRGCVYDDERVESVRDDENQSFHLTYDDKERPSVIY